MKKSRRLIESGIVTAALAITAAAAAVSGDVKDTSQSNKQADNETIFLAENKNAVNAEAKIAVAAADNSQEDKENKDNKEKQNVTAELLVEKDAGFVQTAAADGVEDRAVVDSQGEVADTMFFTVEQRNKVEDHLNSGLAMETQEEKEEKSEWSGKLMANVEDKLNIRAEASKESELAGKLYKGAVADVVEKGDEWSRIKSGNVEGYVKNEYCVFDEDAKALAEKVCHTYAKATTDGLRVREKADTDAKIYTVLTKGQKMEVDTSAKTAEGWVAVKYDGETAYISSEYADVAMKIGKAMTLEEEQQMIEKQEAAKRAAQEAEQKKQQEAAAAAAEKTQSPSKAAVSNDAGISSSVDDVTLLAALIYCEAGAEPYEGQLAVGAVVVNRVQSSVYPNTISEVIYQKGQFSPAASGKLARVLAQGASDSCYKAAREALSGVDNTGGAIGFHAGKGSGTVIGNQTFF